MMIDSAPLVIDSILDVLEAVRAERPTAAAAGEAESDLAAAVEIGDDGRMFVECRGDGSPTVVLISGKGTAPRTGPRSSIPTTPCTSTPATTSAARPSWHGGTT